MNGIEIAALDFVVIGLYFVAILGIAVWVSRGVETGEDLFLAGRSLGWQTVGTSLFASNISSTTLIGLAGAAYVSGIATANYEWMAGVVLVFMSLFYIPIYLRSKISTVPELLERRFDRRSRLYFSGLTIFLTLAVDTAGGIYAGAIVLQVFVPGLDLWTTCIALALVAGLYTVAGGLRAVVYSDVLQAVILITGCTALTVIVFGHYDYSWQAATAALPEGHLSLIRPLDDEMLPWLGTLIGVPVLGFWYWGANQYITQRIFAARSLRDAQWGANLGGLLKLLPLFIMVLPGAMAVGLIEPLEDGDQVFPTLVATMLPAGITGLVLAGLVAAIMSSIDSTLNSSSTLIIKDFVENDDRQLAPAKAKAWGRVTTLVLMAMAALWAPMIANFGGLFAYLQQAFSILVPPVVAIFLLGVFWHRGAGRAALGTLLIGHALGIALFAATQVGLWPLHYTINVGIMTAVSAAIFVALALTEPAPEQDRIRGVRHIARAAEEDDLAWYHRPRLQGFAILALTAVIVLTFW